MCGFELVHFVLVESAQSNTASSYVWIYFREKAKTKGVATIVKQDERDFQWGEKERGSSWEQR